jgi:hypothetical protein
MDAALALHLRAASASTMTSTVAPGHARQPHPRLRRQLSDLKPSDRAKADGMTMTSRHHERRR